MNWIDVEEKLPEDYEEVLCLSVKFGDPKRNLSSHQVILSRENNCWASDVDEDYERNPDYHYITHWMPLPETPENTNIFQRFPLHWRYIFYMTAGVLLGMLL
jgi:hypothetical protein